MNSVSYQIHILDILLLHAWDIPLAVTASFKLSNIFILSLSKFFRLRRLARGGASASDIVSNVAVSVKDLLSSWDLFSSPRI